MPLHPKVLVADEQKRLIGETGVLAKGKRLSLGVGEGAETFEYRTFLAPPHPKSLTYAYVIITTPEQRQKHRVLRNLAPVPAPFDAFCRKENQ